MENIFTSIINFLFGYNEISDTTINKFSNEKDMDFSGGTNYPSGYKTGSAFASYARDYSK